MLIRIGGIRTCCESVSFPLVSQCFVEALVIRTHEVSNDVNYHLEQVTGLDSGAVSGIEEAFKKRLKNFLAEYVFL